MAKKIITITIDTSKEVLKPCKDCQFKGNCKVEEGGAYACKKLNEAFVIAFGEKSEVAIYGNEHIVDIKQQIL